MQSAVSGLNRGLAASEDDQLKADVAAKQLEAVGGLVDLSNDIDKLQGRWKLIYSRVFQRIDVQGKDFDNIVELELGAPWPLQSVEKTTVKTTGNLSHLPPLEVPRIPDAFRPPSITGSGEFEATYLDADTRVTRGELRVFVIS
uniref:Plastid lipid-associated protein/fibrillin conserved domain-containing protein n=1 Tax=Populus trichocarpa TaxID=3694 RepID=A0A2K1YQ53_POPTR